MKKWVILGSKGFEIVGTGGNKPDHAVCEAEDDWEAHDLVVDSDKKIVHIPGLRTEEKPIESPLNLTMNITRVYETSVNWGKYLGYGLLFICLALIVAKYFKVV